MNVRDTSYARYITVGAVACLIVLAIFMIFKSMPKEQVNTDPRVGRVCFDNDCRVSKQCDAKTLVIYTTIPGLPEPTAQRVPKSAECSD